MKMSNKRLEILDVFRGLAVLFVALFHYTSKYSEIFEDDSTIQFFGLSDFLTYKVEVPMFGYLKKRLL